MLAGSLEYDGLGAFQLDAEVTKARLRQLQSLITTPVNMLGVNELHSPSRSTQRLHQLHTCSTSCGDSVTQ